MGHQTHTGFRQLFTTLVFLFIGLLAAGALQAWTGPTQSPPPSVPDGNVAAPINVGATDQVKNAGLSLNSLLVAGNAAVYRAGSSVKLGVNTASPVTALDVNGSIKLGNGGEVCQAVTEGSVRYNSTKKALESCNGTSWGTLTAALAGSQSYTTSGTFTFVVPNYNTSLTVTVNGAGGGAGGAAGVVSTSCGKGCTGYAGVAGISNGNTGGGSSFNGSVLANGGGGGVKAPGTTSAGTAGSGGTASGGDTNTAGGGSSGGAGVNNCNHTQSVTLGGSGAGGAGGQAVKTYNYGAITGSVTVVVGASGGGGSGGSGDQCTGSTGTSGSNGSVVITWQ